MCSRPLRSCRYRVTARVVAEAGDIFLGPAHGKGYGPRVPQETYRNWRSRPRAEHIRRQEMKRMKVMFGKRRVMVLVTLVVLVLAAAALIASSASFTSTSSNNANVFTAGRLTHGNSPSSATLSVDRLIPGTVWVPVGSVTLTNTGDVQGHFWLTTSDLQDTPGAGHSAWLSNVLQLRVMSGATEVYNGPINAVGSPTAEDAGVILASGAATYDFAVMLPDTGNPGGPDLGDNRFQGASMRIDFDWEAITN
jgi:hypothetical protein